MKKDFCISIGLQQCINCCHCDVDKTIDSRITAKTVCYAEFYDDLISESTPAELKHILIDLKTNRYGYETENYYAYICDVINSIHKLQSKLIDDIEKLIPLL
jgi:hypothetical protein